MYALGTYSVSAWFLLCQKCDIILLLMLGNHKLFYICILLRAVVLPAFVLCCAVWHVPSVLFFADKSRGEGHS